MIELYLRIKIHLDVLQEGLNMPNLENQGVLHFEFRCQKLLSLYHNTHILLAGVDLSTKLYHGLRFNRPHLSSFQNMSVKIYDNVFLYLGGYNSIPDFWTMDSSVGPWTLDAGLWTLDSGLWTLNAGCWTLHFGPWALAPDTIVDCFRTKPEGSFCLCLIKLLKILWARISKSLMATLVL